MGRILLIFLIFGKMPLRVGDLSDPKFWVAELFNAANLLMPSGKQKPYFNRKVEFGDPEL